MNRKLFSIIGLVAAIAVVMIFTAGCSNPWRRAASEKAQEETAERMLEKASGGEADVEIDNESTTITTEEGTSAINTDSLPDGFPSDVPIYPDAKIGYSHLGAGEASESASVSLTTGDGVNKVSDWYKSQITGAGWNIEQTNSITTGGSDTVEYYTATKGERELSVTVTPEEGETLITIAVIKN